MAQKRNLPFLEGLFVKIMIKPCRRLGHSMAERNAVSAAPGLTLLLSFPGGYPAAIVFDDDYFAY